ITTPTLTKPSGVLGRLGYRGFSISKTPGLTPESFNLYVHEGIVDKGKQEENLVADNRNLETWLLSTAPPRAIDSNVVNHISTQLRLPALNAVDVINNRMLAAGVTVCPACLAVDAPAYNPAVWNVFPTQPNNNCYNYANNIITNTFAQ